MALSDITDQFSSDINITRKKYQELIIAENHCNLLVDLIHDHYKSGKALYQDDLHVIYEMFCKTDDNDEEESEENNNGSEQ